MHYESSESNSDRSRYPDSDAEKDPGNPEELIPFVNIWPDEEFCDEHVWRKAIALHNRKTVNRRAKRKAIAASAADNVYDGVFVLRCVRRLLEPLDFEDTLSAHRRAVRDNPSLSHAHVQAELAEQRDKFARLQERADYDGYAR
eukprot:1588258-Pleurochrysis_carterae.AAC.1